MAYFQFILTLLIAGAIYLVWHFGLRTYLFDQFRHRLFTLRDELFEFVSESELTYESDAYQILREKINLVIRHSNQIRVTELIRHLILFKFFPHFFKDYSSSEDIIEYADNFDKPYSSKTKSKLKNCENKLNAEIGLHFLKSYPLVTFTLALLVTPIIGVMYIKELIFGGRKKDLDKAVKVQEYIGKSIYDNYEKVSGGVHVIRNQDQHRLNHNINNQLDATT